MTKQIQVSDATHQRIKDMAERSYRTIAGQIDFMVDALSDTQKSITQYDADNKPFQKIDVTPTPEKKIAEAAPRVDDLFSGVTGAVPREQPCCMNELQPCKHWVWDTQSGEGYKNVLSGRFMDVE